VDEKKANITVAAGATVTCTYTNTLVAPLQACSPGYWKQPQHFGNYVDPPVDPWGPDTDATTFGEIFGGVFDPSPVGVGPLVDASVYIPDDIEDLIFPYVIGTGGGGFYVLGRQGAAAYLNALSPGLPGYPYSPEAVIQMVRDAFFYGVGSTQYHDALNAFSATLADENCPLGTATVEDGPDGNGWGSIKPN